MNPKAIHELSLGSIIKGIQSISKFSDSVKDSLDKTDVRKTNVRSKGSTVAKASSIARATEGLVFTYPVLCSSSLDIKSCQLVGKALERRNVTSLQILLAANQLTNKNMMEYLKDFHTNLDFDKISLNDFMDIITETSNFVEMTNTPQALLDMIPLKEKNNMLEDFRNNTNYFFKDDINETCISDFRIAERNGYNTIFEADDKTLKDKVKDAAKDVAKSVIKDTIPPVNKGNNGNKGNSDIRVKTRQDLQGNNTFKYFRDAESINKITTSSANTDRLISSEVKKANEVVPTLMLVNTIDPSTGIEMQSVIGIKSRLIKVPSNEIIDRILARFEDSNYLLKFIKLTTREISFLKDFIFAIDSAKLDAINNSKKGSASALFRALERRAQNGKVRKLARTEKQLAKAIATIIVSQEDVDIIKKEYNIDVEISRVIKPIMERLSLLYFAIVDESSETVKLFIDGSDGYEEYPFSALDRESKDDSYKKVINLMTKMTR